MQSDLDRLIQHLEQIIQQLKVLEVTLTLNSEDWGEAARETPGHLIKR